MQIFSEFGQTWSPPAAQQALAAAPTAARAQLATPASLSQDRLPGALAEVQKLVQRMLGTDVDVYQVRLLSCCMHVHLHWAL